MRKNIVSIDSVVLLLATLSVIKFVPAKPIVYPIVLLALMIYVFLDLMLRTEEDDSVYRYKFCIIICIIFLVAVLPCLHKISLRHHGERYDFAHDGGVLMTEEGVRSLLQGKNPYEEDYSGTALDEYYTAYKLDEIKSSLIRHYTYLPLTFVLPAPVSVLSKALIGWFDMRFVYLLMFIITLFILPKLADENQNKALLLITFAVNPFLTPFVASGRNDVFVLFWIILSVLFLVREKPRTASAFLGCACASKATAWFLVPFFLAYLLDKQDESISPTGKISFMMKQTYPLLVLFVVLVFPFLMWDFHSFTEDIFRWDVTYPLGGTPGFGFANLLLYAGYSKSDYFPFKYLQLILGIPLLLFLLKRQLRRNSINVMLVHYGLLSLTLLYFSRFLHDNYIGYVVSLICLGCFVTRGKQIPS